MDSAILPTGVIVTALRQKLNRSTVIEMAAVIADAEGIDAVSLQRIANDAGVKQPALYRHVTGIEELWKLLALRARQLLASALSSAATGLSRDAAVMAVAIAWREFVKQHPGLYSATDRVPSVGDSDIEASLGEVIRTLDAALNGYRLTTDQRAHCARSLRSALHGFCVLEKDSGHPEPYALQASLDNLVQLLCRGISALEPA
jgi:AcrR family transcriptional regulator